MITSLVHMGFMMNLALGSLLMRDINSSIHTIKHQLTVSNDRLLEENIHWKYFWGILFNLKQYQTNRVPKCPQLWAGY